MIREQFTIENNLRKAAVRQEMLITAVFLISQEIAFLRNQNAMRGSHCGGMEDVACATRCRRRRILSYHNFTR